jgi:(p)ppGpp synthase/HD superfamily hydrolase
MFQDNVFCFTPKGAVIKLPKDATPIDFAYAVHTSIGDAAISCHINGRESTLQAVLKNGDMVNIINSKKASPSLHWLSSCKTGKARSAIRRHWQGKSSEKANNDENKIYGSTLIIDLPHQPGVLGEVSTLIGLSDSNILNVELVEKKDKYLQFSFDLQIKDLKKFTNLISQIKQKNLNFRIIRHKQKKNALIQRIFKNFKRN